MLEFSDYKNQIITYANLQRDVNTMASHEFINGRTVEETQQKLKRFYDELKALEDEYDAWSLEMSKEEFEAGKVIMEAIINKLDEE